ncbi:hypothetical protein CBE89_02925 [Corynebacterium striatum]|uniref:Uncharacterized protein n=1 Tax=Corynebacterium striatum TaxID=43770 RepID=A0A2Z2IWF6_CORST|nr:hypothetical protein [Corynebacterium striatum]ART20566.1 hypothetical protein CBE89_02925 [Corynebacterium striatum]HAT1304197.1 hypothetical protein [Corynebacterium striatum]HAT1392876.1 hypothetical protein [Corynebacterium striatum]HCG3140073.1 hypothetical protein [Corynebacterium striatum]
MTFRLLFRVTELTHRLDAQKKFALEFEDEVIRWADRMEWSLNPDVSFDPQTQLVEVIYPVDQLPGEIQAVVKYQLSTRMGLKFLRIA